MIKKARDCDNNKILEKHANLMKRRRIIETSESEDDDVEDCDMQLNRTQNVNDSGEIRQKPTDKGKTFNMYIFRYQNTH